MQIRKLFRWLPAVALVVALALPAGFAAAQDAPTGADSAAGCIVDGIRLMRDRQVGPYMKLFPEMNPEVVEQFAPLMAAALDALKITQFEIVEFSCDGDSARATVDWDAEFDTNAFIEAVAKLRRDHLLEQGVDPKAIDDLINRDEILHMAKEFAEPFATPRAVITAVRIDGRWYLEKIDPERGATDEPRTDLPNGADTAVLAVRSILAAAQVHDEAAILAMIPPQGHEQFMRDGGLAMMAATTLVESRIVEVDENEDRATVTVEWDTEFDPAVFAREAKAMMREVLAGTGMSAAEINQAIKSAEPGIREQAAYHKAQIEADRFTFNVVRIEGRWYIASGRAAADEGDENGE